MALLSEQEREELKKRGLWVREKCDVCHKPILSPLTYIKKGQTVCVGCAKGQDDEVIKNIKEENVMAKQKAVKKEERKGKPATTKVGGYLLAGTALADLYEVLIDEKKHGFAELKKIVAKHKKDLPGRLGNLRRVGEKKKAWSLLVDSDASTVQMKLGAGKPAAKEEPATKSAKKAAEPVAKKKAAEPTDISPKTLKAAATLVRRTLKSGKDWTRNKLTEHLVNKENMDPATVKEALNSEIKAGGITVEDGILVLA